jgi:hypothetical protein
VVIETALPSRPGGLALGRFGWNEHLGAAVDDVLHLLGVPVAGIGDSHARGFSHTGASELALGGLHHRLEVPEVR